MGRTRRIATVGLVAASATAAVAFAERRSVGRWEAADDPYGAEPTSILDALPGATVTTVTSADGARLRVVEGGTGPATVVLAHGVTATSDHWAPVAARLARRGRRVVAFDHRGHGGSTAGSGDFGIDRFAEDVDAVVSATAPEGAVVAGHSMGGIAVQAWLAAHGGSPTAAQGAVLVATLSRPVGGPLTELMRRLGGTALARRTMAHPVHGRVMARGGLGRVPSIAVLDVVRGGWARCPDSTRAGVFRDLAFDFTDALGRVDVPTAVICGELDKVTPPAESERIAGLVADARLHLVPDAGHEVIWEAADRVADVVDDVVERSRSGGGR